MKLEEHNEAFRNSSPKEIISWALSIANKPIITTNFGPFSGSLLHSVVCQAPKIDVIWIDTGYNTSQTYKHALETIKLMNLNIHIYVPKQTTAYRDIILGIPSLNDPKHAVFTEQVKLEPFKRAMNIHKPDVWFTNLRKGKTDFRNKLDVLSYSKDGVLKVCPFFNYSDKDLEKFLKSHRLQNETKYFDPTKQIENRECGLHY